MKKIVRLTLISTVFLGLTVFQTAYSQGTDEDRDQRNQQQNNQNIKDPNPGYKPGEGEDREEWEQKRGNTDLEPGDPNYIIQQMDWDGPSNSPLQVGKIQIDQGPTIYLAEDNSRPMVFGAVIVRAGAKYDPPEATGMAHYLEHMLFKGTDRMGTSDFNAEKPVLMKIDSLYKALGNTEKDKDRQAIQQKINKASIEAAKYVIPNELNNILESIGATKINAFTTQDMIVYHNYFPSHQLSKWLRVYGHRFSNPVFRGFQTELETVYEEKNRAMDNFGFRLMEAYMKELYPNHPYGTSAIGKTEHLKNPSLSAMREFYDKYYNLSNMAIILVGDINAEKAARMIPEAFNGVPRDKTELPVFGPAEEFEGREFKKVRLTPVKVGLMGYHTVPHGHPDEAAIEIASWLVSNNNQTGLADEYMLKDELLLAKGILDVKADRGSFTVLFAPRVFPWLFGQSLKNAESLIDSAFYKLRNGDFNPEDMSAARTNIIKERKLRLESLSGRGIAMAESFVYGQEWSDYLRYEEKLKDVTKSDIERIAKKYFGDDKLVMWSKMGFPKNDKLEQPGYATPAFNDSARSEFSKQLDYFYESEPQGKFIDFQKDLTQVDIWETTTLYHVENPVNDVFELKFRYCRDNHADSMMAILPIYLNLVGPAGFGGDDFKKVLAQSGTNYNFSQDENYSYLTITGKDKYFDKTLNFFSKFFGQINMDEDMARQTAQKSRAERKVEKKSPRVQLNALEQYVLYGENSDYIARPSKKVLKNMDGRGLAKSFEEMINRTCEISYSGSLGADSVESVLLRNYFKKLEVNELPGMDIPPRQDLDESKVYFFHNKKARQSRIKIFISTGESTPEDYPVRRLFNSYFGKGMSSLMFQEIREKRALAYSTWAQAKPGRTKKEDGLFEAYIGCQSDKTNEALEVAMNLIRDMPAKEDRMSRIKRSNYQEMMTSYPDFRDLALTVSKLQRIGFSEDPNAFLASRVMGMGMKDVFRYYEEKIKSKPAAIVIVGNKKDIDLKKLEEYGELVKLKKKDIRTK